jgi:hypothetical protein
MSAGMLLPANSIRVSILLVCNISMIALPPNSPTLFHRKSVTSKHQKIIIQSEPAGEITKSKEMILILVINSYLVGTKRD